MKKLLYCSVLLGLAACSGSSPDKTVQNTENLQAATMSEIAARIDGEPVALSEVDALIELPLYEIELQKYQIRKESIRRLADYRGGAAEILLEPPKPPRLNIKLGDRPIRGNENAPVILSVFCSFQSSHCARLQPVLDQLRTDNEGLLSLAYFDFPQRYHRYGMDAANAVRCAFEGGENWDYLDSMFGIYDDLNFDRFSRLAIQTGVTPNSFKTCYEDGTYKTDIQSDVDYAQSLGLSKVPIVLINGLYMSGPLPAEGYQIYIDQELARLGVEKPTPEKQEKETSVEARDDDPIVLDGIGRDRVRGVDGGMPLRDKSEVTLNRLWVNETLREEAAIAAYFKKAPHAPGGNHVLKLADVSGHEFFETMGFRTGDVILQANGEWIHEGQNGLWNELRYSDKVEVKLMRRGKPVTYYYRFQD